MAKYNRADARKLYDELQEQLRSIPGDIERQTDDGPVIDIMCEALGAAISALKNGPEREPH